MFIRTCLDFRVLPALITTLVPSCLRNVFDGTRWLGDDPSSGFLVRLPCSRTAIDLIPFRSFFVFRFVFRFVRFVRMCSIKQGF